MYYGNTYPYLQAFIQIHFCCHIANLLCALTPPTVDYWNSVIALAGNLYCVAHVLAHNLVHNTNKQGPPSGTITQLEVKNSTGYL